MAKKDTTASEGTPLEEAQAAETTSKEAVAAADTEPVEKQPKEGSLKEADKASGGFIDDAEPNDEPVRGALPTSKLITSLAVGAGAHQPPDSDLIGADGRPVQAVIQEAAQVEN